ncbi:MAG: tellurite resistance protein [Pseudonocardiales bacterium]|nr:tellurite resistance protein [Pseudonocardiales bacterium]
MTTTLIRDAPVSAARIPLTTFAIGFGLSGLAGAWTAASPALGLPHVVSQAFWAVAAIAWVWLLVAHVARGMRSGEPLLAQLRHPVQGPVASLAPVTAMMLAAQLFSYSPLAGWVLYLAALAASAVLAAFVFGFWFEGRLELAAMHPGYLLPTVAPGFIGADVAMKLGSSGLAWALFGVGTFFGVAMTAVVVLRLTFYGALPDALAPTMMILLAPPAVAGISWFTLNGHEIDPVAQAMAGLGVVLLLMQAGLLPRYLRLPFSLGFWSFTFPLAAAVVLTEQWLQITQPAGWHVLTGVLVAALTVFIGGVGVRSLRWN